MTLKYLAILAILPMLIIPVLVQENPANAITITDPTQTDNAVKIKLNSERNHAIINWNFGEFAERAECVVKTELITWSDDGETFTIYNFIGKDKSNIQEGALLFKNIENIDDAVIPCNESIHIKIAKLDFINQDDYEIYTTFGALIDDEYVNVYADSPFLKIDTNILLMNEVRIEDASSGDVIFDRVSCAGSNDLVKFTYFMVDKLGIQRGQVTHELCESL